MLAADFFTAGRAAGGPIEKGTKKNRSFSIFFGRYSAAKNEVSRVGEGDSFMEKLNFLAVIKSAASAASPTAWGAPG